MYLPDSALKYLSHRMINSAGGNLLPQIAKYLSPILAMAIDHKKIIGVALGCIGSVIAYNELKKLGNTPPLELNKPKIVEFKLFDDNAIYKTFKTDGLEIEVDPGDTIASYEVKTLEEIEVLMDSITDVKSREEMIAWIIKFQEITNPNATGLDVVKGTVAAGFVFALRSALAAENMGFIDDKAMQPLIEGFVELKRNNNLNILNSILPADFTTFQNVEIKNLKNHVKEFDTITTFIANINPATRSSGSILFSKAPTGIAQATLGVSRIFKGVFDYAKDVYGFIQMMERNQIG